MNSKNCFVLFQVCPNHLKKFVVRIPVVDHNFYLSSRFCMVIKLQFLYFFLNTFLGGIFPARDVTVFSR